MGRKGEDFRIDCTFDVHAHFDEVWANIERKAGAHLSKNDALDTLLKVYDLLDANSATNLVKRARGDMVAKLR